MTNAIQINNMGETIEIKITNSTTASDVVGIVNDQWPGTSRLVSCDIIRPTEAKISKEQKRKQKAIDRMAWEGERRQRYQKGGHFK
ncbi:hypothetical protein M0R72_08385 [Candidatus Pacearchaeota archaeon]|jgi:hypothetical protein|nr:hypothetical protein [Candidatus Pacearchaeota archaeon]